MKRDLLTSYANAENIRRTRLVAIDAVVDDINRRLSKRLTCVGSRMVHLVDSVSHVTPDSQIKPLLQGMEMIHLGMIHTFAKYGLEPVTVDIGQRFDSKLMESRNQVALTAHPIVSSMVSPGWQLRGGVIVKAVVDVE